MPRTYDKEHVGAKVTTLERRLLLEALILLWERETNENVLSDRSELERCICWQLLALDGAYDRHAQKVRRVRETA